MGVTVNCERWRGLLENGRFLGTEWLLETRLLETTAENSVPGYVAQGIYQFCDNEIIQEVDR